jgi:hypothetical protein
VAGFNSVGKCNLVLLYRGHHLTQHEGEFRIQRLGRGRFRCADPRLLPDHVDPAQFSDTDTPVEHDYADIPADAATTRWTGDRLDRHYAISVLANTETTGPSGQLTQFRLRSQPADA